MVATSAVLRVRNICEDRSEVEAELYIGMGRVSARKKRGFIGVKAWEKQRSEATAAEGTAPNEGRGSEGEGRPITTTTSACKTPKSMVGMKQLRNMSEEKLANSDFHKIGGGRVMTRARARTLGMQSRRPKVDVASGPKIQDFSLLNECLSKAATCSHCRNSRSTLKIFQENDARSGLAESLFMCCSSCGTKTKFFSSKKMPGRQGGFEINRRSDIASQSRQKLENFCTKMNLPSPILSKPYNNHLKEAEEVYCKEAECKMKDAAERLIEKTELEEPQSVSKDENGNRIAEVGVTVDGSWQKRGHTSKIGVVFLLSVLTGEVLDFEVMSLYCHACVAHSKLDKQSEVYINWMNRHQKDCQINHQGTSGEMETQGAIRMFSRSIESRNLKYTQFVGDGDSSRFGWVAEEMKQKYGASYVVMKEECVGHVQKRMGTALDEYKKE